MTTQTNTAIDLNTETTEEKEQDFNLSDTETQEYSILHNQLLEAKLSLANLELQKQEVMNFIFNANQNLVEKLTKFAESKNLNPNEVKFDPNTMTFTKLTE